MSSLDNVQAGDELIRRHWNGYSGASEKRDARRLKVTRVTPTQIVIGRERFYKKDGRRVGDPPGARRTKVEIPKAAETEVEMSDADKLVLRTVFELGSKAWMGYVEFGALVESCLRHLGVEVPKGVSLDELESLAQTKLEAHPDELKEFEAESGEISKWKVGDDVLIRGEQIRGIGFDCIGAIQSMKGSKATVKVDFDVDEGGGEGPATKTYTVDVEHLEPNEGQM